MKHNKLSYIMVLMPIILLSVFRLKAFVRLFVFIADFHFQRSDAVIMLREVIWMRIKTKDALAKGASKQKIIEVPIILDGLI